MSFWQGVKEYGSTIWKGGTAVVDTIARGGSLKDGFNKQADIYASQLEKWGVNKNITDPYREYYGDAMMSAITFGVGAAAANKISEKNQPITDTSNDNPTPISQIDPTNTGFNPLYLLPLIFLL